MSLVTPTTAQINAAIIAQLEISLSQTIPLLPKAFNRVLAKVLAALYVILWKYGGSIYLQVFVRTATIEEVEIFGRTVSPLKEWGRLIGVGDPAAAEQAQLDIDITVFTTGGNLDAGTQFIGVDSGVTYLLNVTVALVAGVVPGTVTAKGDEGGGDGSGVIGNLEIGEEIKLANALANVKREAVVTAQAATGADEEDTEVYRQRVLDFFQKRPQGGALLDYELWGEESAGVLNIYPYTGAVGGETDNYVESATEVDGIPTPAQLQQALDDINLDDSGLASRRPANAFPNVFPITRTAFTVTVDGILDADGDPLEGLAALQTSITAEVETFFLSRAPFIPGVSPLPRADILARNTLTGLVSDLVTAAGGVFTSVQFKLTAGGDNIFEYIVGSITQGEKAKADSVVFT